MIRRDSSGHNSPARPFASPLRLGFVPGDHSGALSRSCQFLSSDAFCGRVWTRRGCSPSLLPPTIPPPAFTFSTVHSAKGREADYVVVLDLKDGRWGFPSRIEDNSLLELVFPPASGGNYPFAEERRLFYVAMTRARIGVYLITDPVRPSTFIAELLQQPSSIRQIGALAPECPRCHRGRLLLKNSSRGPFWGCTEYRSEPSCPYTRDAETPTSLARNGVPGRISI